MDRGFGPWKWKNVLCFQILLLGEKKEKRCCEWSEKESKLIARIRGSSASAYDVKRLFS